MPGGISGLYPSLDKQKKEEAKKAKKVKKIKKENEMEDDRFELIESGANVIRDILKNIKKPANAKAKKEIAESLKILDKKVKMLKKDEALRTQYIDRTAFDTIQGVFQALHLYIISTIDMVYVDLAVEWLRSHETSYDIADRMQKAALARADFSGKRA